MHPRHSRVASPGSCRVKFASADHNGYIETCERAIRLSKFSPRFARRRKQWRQLGPMMSVRVTIADPHEVVRAGLCDIFADTDIDVVGQASTVAGAVKLIERRRPDIALMDLRFQGESSLDVLAQIREKAPQTRVVVLTAYADPFYVARAVALGVEDYLLKTLTSRALVDAVLAVAADQGPTQHGIMQPIVQTMAAAGELPRGVSLTRRELQVLRHVGLGLSNKEIASSLKISVQTVKEHMRHILAKIKASDRTAAAVWAIRKQLV